MKYSAIFTLLALLGVFLIVYALNNSQLVNWDLLEPILAQKQITTQSETVKLLIDFYNRGILSEYLRSGSVAAFASGLALICGGFLGALHIIIEKLFFKKFYENPNPLLALRRGVLVSLFPIIIVYLGLYNFLNLTMLVLVTLCLILVEVVLTALKIFTPEGKLVNSTDDMQHTAI